MEKFYLLFNTAKETGESGESAGGIYDMTNACKNCGTGYRLIGNLPVKAINLKNDFTETLDKDYIISEKLYFALRSSDIKMNNLLYIINSKSKKELPFYYFNPDLSFPKMLPESEGIITDEQCSICKQNGFFDNQIFPKNLNGEVILDQIKFIPRKYKYSIIDIPFIDKSDIFYTWEHFGYSNLKNDGKYVIRYARPRLIVSEKVKHLFEVFPIKNVLFEEVYFE